MGLPAGPLLPWPPRAPPQRPPGLDRVWSRPQEGLQGFAGWKGSGPGREGGQTDGRTQGCPGSMALLLTHVQLFLLLPQVARPPPGSWRGPTAAELPGPLPEPPSKVPSLWLEGAGSLGRTARPSSDLLLPSASSPHGGRVSSSKNPLPGLPAAPLSENRIGWSPGSPDDPGCLRTRQPEGGLCPGARPSCPLSVLAQP